ncbi:hypothetical protein J4N42_06380 [Vibrio sp. SCSIO 43135]|uniref:Uncharacterized protein n=1 Tax=Vibrio paucivorans TaxID=2829489 RepID=A0A9X3CED8_9VIBR|nr:MULTISPECIES: hypothetical protein [Vibrio]MCW8334064.1 hypothetical protein [Vibrio paucivorans]USD42342.1 hypothetical protein J4N42_06380 [Vibrio sp. SCSIO 43135]
MQAPIQNQLSLRLLLLTLALVLVSWPVVISSSFTVASITATVLGIWLVLVATLIGLSR